MTTDLDIKVLKPGTTEVLDFDVQNAVSGVFEQQPSQMISIPPIPRIPREEVRADTERISAAHDQILIGSLLDTRLRMREPINVHIEQEGEFYLAKFDDLNEFGYGDDPIQAVQDLRNTLAELYWSLQADRVLVGSTTSDITRLKRSSKGTLTPGRSGTSCS